ncbi:MAG: malate synthase G, partial [Neisseriaceae bacterium]|nr:malate synthase G [Neisseriaceae bacterium]
MTDRISVSGLQPDKQLYDFIEKEVLPNRGGNLSSAQFWDGFAKIVAEFAPRNKALLGKRDELQSKIDAWHETHKGKITDMAAYKAFLKEIGYLQDEPADFQITTSNVDFEFSHQAGPQLVVPIMNARYALNAANARWGSLYDALYGTNAIEQTGELAITKEFNPKRGAKVIAFARDFLDNAIPLKSGSHKDATAYKVVSGSLKVVVAGAETELQTPSLFVGYNGTADAPTSLLFLHNGLHFDIIIDKTSP